MEATIHLHAESMQTLDTDFMGLASNKTDAFYGVSGVLFEDMDRAFKDVLNA